MKLCIDCRHCHTPDRYHTGFFSVRRVSDVAGSRCKRTDLIDGKGSTGSYCTTERLASVRLLPDSCGIEGQFFEAKP